MRYTYKFREIQNELSKQGLKMLVYKDIKKNIFFVAKNEVILSKHIILHSIVKTYNLNKDICIDITDSKKEKENV